MALPKLPTQNPSKGMGGTQTWASKHLKLPLFFFKPSSNLNQILPTFQSHSSSPSLSDQSFHFAWPAPHWCLFPRPPCHPHPHVYVFQAISFTANSTKNFFVLESTHPSHPLAELLLLNPCFLTQTSSSVRFTLLMGFLLPAQCQSTILGRQSAQELTQITWKWK